MPIDKIYADSMLGTFRNMLQECKNKNLGGPAFDTMNSILQKMESLAMEMDDFSAYSAKLMTEGYMNDFSLAYGKLLSETAARQYNHSTSDYNDNTLLQQTIKAYEDYLTQLNTSLDKEKLQEPIKEVIAIGKSGVNYPTFLRLMIEKGLDKLMEGTIVLRKYLEEDIEWASKMFFPIHEKRNRTILNKYDELAKTSPFGAPDSFTFNLEKWKIEWAFQPEINRYNSIIERWKRILDTVHMWIDAHTSFAIYDERFVHPNGKEATLRLIKYVKDCYPGFLKVKENIFHRYFNINWEDFFSHESFYNERKARRCLYTDEYIEFLKLVHSHCKPFNNAPKDLIEMAEKLYVEKNIFIRLNK